MSPDVADLAARRLRAQGLIGKPFASAVDAVRWLGAVQSQDYGGAKWALGQRTRGATDLELDRLFDEGAILRTHVMRPTWHFVLPEDIRWLQELTSARVVAGIAGRYRQLELDDRTIGRAMELFAEALSSGRFLTRAELGEVLQAGGILAEGQRLPHLIAAAELASLITSGPRRGKQFTYALLEERAPAGRPLDRDEALTALTLRYFRSHGPAQVQDFAWWSGLTMVEIRKGIHLVGGGLERETMDGKDFWSDPKAARAGRIDPLAHLLPNFDELTVAYRDRGALLDPRVPFNPSFFAYYRESTPQGGMLSNVVTIAGRVRGAWSRTLAPKLVRVHVRPLAPFSASDVEAVDAAAKKLGRFLQLNAEVRVS